MEEHLTGTGKIRKSYPVRRTLNIATDYPVIVCLCGSTRFYKEYQKANYDFSMKGCIVLSVGFYMHSSEQAHGEKWGCTDKQKIELDALHKRKIDLADIVYVINPKGYIGKSTKSEIEYAIKHNKQVFYLERK